MEGVFYRDLILHDFKVDNKDDCFEKLAEILKKLKYIDDKRIFIEKLYEREKEYSTSVGNFIAIPHCVCTSVNKPFISYARLVSPIEWKSSVSNCNEVLHVFLIGINENKESEHLQMLAFLARNLMHEDFREKLFGAKTEDEVFEMLKKIQEVK